jgi:hypothetical protein
MLCDVVFFWTTGNNCDILETEKGGWTVRFLILVGIGALVAAYALRRMWAKRARLRGTVRASATVLEVAESPWPVPGESGSLYRVRARYVLPGGQAVEALSQNTVHAPGDFPPGSRVEIAYDPDAPETFYVLRDREYTDLIFLCFGIFVLLVGVILWIAD